MKPAAIDGSLVDMYNVAVHKMVQLVIHVPAERGAELVEAFGWPTMANPVPVAVARLVSAAAPPTIPAAAAERPSPVASPGLSAEKPLPRKWEKISFAQQAGIRCADPIFQAYLRERLEYVVHNEADATNVIRELCGVESRRDIRPGTDAAEGWHQIDSEYQAWEALERVS